MKNIAITFQKIPLLSQQNPKLNCFQKLLILFQPKLNGTEKPTSPESEEHSQTTEDNNSEKQPDGEPGDESGDDVMDELEEDEEGLYL